MGSASLAAARPAAGPPARPPARTVTTIPLQPGGLRGKNLQNRKKKLIVIKQISNNSHEKINAVDRDTETECIQI